LWLAGGARQHQGVADLVSTAHLLVGALAHSGRWRGWLSASVDSPHLIDGLDRVTRALGGCTIAWRFDRMATVINPESGRVQASFSAVAKHYGVAVRPCPPRRGNRKGVVEKANHVAAQRFWRTLPDDVTIEQAQARLELWCTTIRDGEPVVPHLQRVPAVTNTERGTGRRTCGRAWRSSSP
jgi:transposase